MDSAAWIALITLGAVLYDLLWRGRPRLRARIKTWKDSKRLDLMLINRGGGSYTVVQVTVEIARGDGSYPKVTWDGGPVVVAGHNAVSIRLDPPLQAAGSILVETVPMGERWFPLPPPGWSGHQKRWIPKTWGRLTGWGDVPRGVSRELRGQGRPPSLEEPTKFR